MHHRPRLRRLQTLLRTKRGCVVPLPPRLARLYGELRVVKPDARPWVVSNFVSTIDGVVSLRIRGHEGGGDISGFSAEDRAVMGMVRATADVVIVGGGSLAADPYRMWTPQAICPELAGDYRRLRTVLGKAGPALKVVVSSSGQLDLRSPVFTDSDGPLLVVTSRPGAERLAARPLAARVEIHAIKGRSGNLAAGDILDAVCRRVRPRQVLVEGGPRLLGSFYAARLVDEQFLTLAPQLAGRQIEDRRLSLVMGRWLAPKDPRWGTLVDLRHCASHLFLRYSFAAKAAGSPLVRAPAP